MKKVPLELVIYEVKMKWSENESYLDSSPFKQNDSHGHNKIGKSTQVCPQIPLILNLSTL